MLSILEERSPARTSGFSASAPFGKRISVVLVDDDAHFRDAQEELGAGFEVQGFASGADPSDTGKDSSLWLVGMLIGSIVAVGLLGYVSFGM